MDIFGAVKGWYNQILTEAAFDINVCVQDQGKADSVKNMISAVRRYHDASECLKLVDVLEQNYKGGAQQQTSEAVEQEASDEA